ncbi:MAG: phage tail protein [Azoarcus sp.]|jgi:hypothetical protein|nr:phage tail protein [Azoarcus sp.]
MPANNYHTLLTHLGAADAVASPVWGVAVPLTHMVFGDGGGSPVVPTEAMTELVHEVYRVGISSIARDPDNEDWLVVEAVIPANVGGWTIREIGLIGGLNSDNYAETATNPGEKLLAVGNFPETYKPVLAEGVAKDLAIRMIVQIGNAEVVNLIVDPSVVVATQESVAQAIAGHDAGEDSHPIILNRLTALESNRAIFLKSGDELPDHDVGPIWHPDYNDWMTFQHFSANGANYHGYASRLVGKFMLDSQPVPRAGYVATGATGLSKTTYAALWNWALHHGRVVAPDLFVAGEILVADHGGDIFDVYDLRERYPRAAGPGHLFGVAESDAVKSHLHDATMCDANTFKDGTDAGKWVIGAYNPTPPYPWVSTLSGPVAAGSANENRPLSTVFFGAAKF